MKQMTGSVSRTVLAMSAMLFLIIAIGSAFSHAEEKADVSKAVFYVG